MQENSQIIEKLKRARTHLLMNSSYNAAVIASLSIKYPFIAGTEYQDFKIDTAATNGAVIVFNPDYIETLSINQCQFVIAHETMHCMLMHHLRRSGRDLNLWNIAGDHIINEILFAAKIGELIPGALFDPRFHGMNIEHVFKILQDEKNDKSDNQDSDSKNDSGSGAGQTDNKPETINHPAGGVLDAPKDINPADVESELKTDIITAEKFAEKSIGPGSGAGSILKKLLDTITAPKANWKDELKTWFDQTDKSDFSFMRPRHSSGAYLLPGLHSDAIGKLIIAFDVSGSVTGYPGALESFQSEINVLRSQFQFETDLIYFHSHIERIETYQKHETIEIEIRETGGTALKPVFDHIEETGLNNQISGLIVFTDLEIFDFPETEPSFKTLFVKYGNRNFCETAPIGKTINIE